MKKEEIIDKIVDIATESAFNGLSTIYAEREATELAKNITDTSDVNSRFWSVAEIVEELKDIDAFDAAEYFFEKFGC